MALGTQTWAQAQGLCILSRKPKTKEAKRQEEAPGCLWPCPLTPYGREAALCEVFSILTSGKGLGESPTRVSFPDKVDVFNPLLWDVAVGRLHGYSFHPKAVVPRMGKALPTFWSSML